MNKEELRHLSSDCEYFLNGSGRGEINLHNFVENLRTTYIEPKEKRIEELEETINKLREQLSLRYNLEDKITELKLKLEALEGQTPWKDIKNKSELIKENAELKAQLESERDLPAIAYMQGAEKQKKKDKEELKKWKDEWQEQVQKATDEGYARTLQTMQLTKAIEIIKNLMLYVPVDLKEYEEAKQFLKGDGCPDCLCEDCTKEDCETKKLGFVEVEK